MCIVSKENEQVQQPTHETHLQSVHIELVFAFCYIARCKHSAGAFSQSQWRTTIAFRLHFTPCFKSKFQYLLNYKLDAMYIYIQILLIHFTRHPQRFNLILNGIQYGKRYYLRTHFVEHYPRVVNVIASGSSHFEALLG